MLLFDDLASVPSDVLAGLEDTTSEIQLLSEMFLAIAALGSQLPLSLPLAAIDESH